MDKHQIIITVDLETGEVKSEVKGLKGGACTTANKWVDGIGKVTQDIHTPEYYEDPQQSVKVGYSSGG
jgi:hypothetical protein